MLILAEGFGCAVVHSMDFGGDTTCHGVKFESDNADAVAANRRSLTLFHGIIY
jgi:hypothetical protein